MKSKTYTNGIVADTLDVTAGRAVELVSGVLGEDVALVVEAGDDPGEAAVRALVPPIERVGGRVVEPQVEGQRQLAPVG